MLWSRPTSISHPPGKANITLNALRLLRRLVGASHSFRARARSTRFNFKRSLRLLRRLVRASHSFRARARSTRFNFQHLNVFVLKPQERFRIKRVDFSAAGGPRTGEPLTCSCFLARGGAVHMLGSWGVNCKLEGFSHDGRKANRRDRHLTERH